MQFACSALQLHKGAESGLGTVAAPKADVVVRVRSVVVQVCSEHASVSSIVPVAAALHSPVLNPTLSARTIIFGFDFHLLFYHNFGCYKINLQFGEHICANKCIF